MKAFVLAAALLLLPLTAVASPAEAAVAKKCNPVAVGGGVMPGTTEFVYADKCTGKVKPAKKHARPSNTLTLTIG